MGLLLAGDWSRRKSSYDFVVIGSGYGGAIAAARLAAADADPRPSVCVLERGREWETGKFPDTLDGVLRETRSKLHPLGLYEFLNYREIGVIKGSGLGGTSLINANVAIVPDEEAFKAAGWPRSLNLDALKPYYDRASAVLDASPHPQAHELPKVQALQRRSGQIGIATEALPLAVNFKPAGVNPHGVHQEPCTGCGDCVTGCNIGAKNTLAMNYLPMAKKAGAELFTQVQADWIEKLPGGGWRVHGRHFRGAASSRSFQLEAKNVVLAAGAINTTEILLRSEARGLKVSPRLGSGFSGNGDFFGLSYNGDFQTQVLGFGHRPDDPRAGRAPGPTIAGVVRYHRDRPIDQRILIEDLSFPSAYVSAARAAFAVLRGEDSDTGDEAEEARRIQRDLSPFTPNHPGGALNHTMLYLCMGFDDARGSILFDAPWHDRSGRVRIEWEGAGQQTVFARINEELRRHARAQGGSFIQNPMWAVLNSRRLITAHPLGGCPIGEDYQHGAADEFGRVFSSDGSVHEGLFVADGALIPAALGVNPFLTISALAERIAQRKVRQLQGDTYPAPPVSAGFSAVDALDYTGASEAELERLFRRAPSMAADTMLNQGGVNIDLAAGIIRNDESWRGFFPRGHVLNAMSAALFTGFKKRFFRSGRRYAGLTSDTGNRINARNTLEEITIKKRQGDLGPGRYILLRYLDPPWQHYYDVFKVINEDLLIGRVYFGSYPHGIRLFTFPMTRRYRLEEMTAGDHRTLFDGGSVPTAPELDGLWRMDAISNANRLSAAAYLKFDLKPDGRLESRYQLLGLMEGLVMPSFLPSHFQLHDFTPFHDEIRKVADGFCAGKYVMELPPAAAALMPPESLGLLQTETVNGAARFGFYYTLTRTGRTAMPASRWFSPLLGVRLPAGAGMSFDEEMAGWYWPGAKSAGPGREADLEIAGRDPAGAMAASFKLRMTVRELNEFIESAAHEAQASGSIRFESFEGHAPAVFGIDEKRSFFRYLTVNPATTEAEMRYHLEFQDTGGRRFLFEGRKYMQKDEAGGGVRGMREVLADYTTLYCRVYEITGAARVELGTALLKFRTFEDLDGVRNLAGFLRSFRITGTQDPILQLRARMRFIAFTAQFVQQEYDPLGPGIGVLRDDVRAEIARGAGTPDYFSTRPSVELQSVLRAAPSLPLEKLLNRGEVRIDFSQKRIFRDSFWKGSFAEDSLPGWEEKVRNGIFGARGLAAARPYAGGSFWKRFDSIDNGVARGHVVNYELAFLPGDPEVREVVYPKDDRRYFLKGDRILLLTYRNEPYRIVYDTIKVIDENNAIGVMHLGDFPDGMEFASFVMARHNYPFGHMAVDDHRRIFADARLAAPEAAGLAGSWSGRLIYIAHPNLTLLNQVSPVLFRVEFNEAAGGLHASYRFGLARRNKPDEFTGGSGRLLDAGAVRNEMRRIDADMLIGRWVCDDPAPLLPGLQDYLELEGGRLAFRYLLTRG
jgi:cholesterol oxidase